MSVPSLSRRDPAPHVLMTLDAVGGVWRYAMDLAAGLAGQGYAFTFAGFGPPPSPSKRAEAERIGQVLWFDAPLDWLAADETQLNGIPDLIHATVVDYGIDLVHLNLPSQACGLQLDIPVLVVSHSCVVTWFAAVRHSAVPADWQWQLRLNRQGFDVADAVLAPSHAHAEALQASYGPIEGLQVVHNGTNANLAVAHKEAMVFAAGRWWDDGKNGALLDGAAGRSAWPIVMAGPSQGPNGQRSELRCVRALGELPHTEVSHWMARAAIVASPSRYEPFGLAPLEAANAGAALVLADIPTYRELWDGAALFAGPDDVPAFAEALNRLASDDAMRHEFSARARHRSRRYTVDAQVDAMHSLYHNMLQPRAVQEG
jgi:glycosyltransferase involved in cell wall biosynthesis